MTTIEARSLLTLQSQRPGRIENAAGSWLAPRRRERSVSDGCKSARQTLDTGLAIQRGPAS